ncbi:hypothetical protein DH2020_007749 [Rehmannia glutinosa]|uniref:C2H2-type domain-containing protein n=1 Tax=Rehmannia glutinosa TaxID=99300 RepID=A0ABR0U022_REHGL
MASVTVDSTPTTADGGSLRLDSIPIVDLRFLSQSELYSLSLCSSSAFDPRRCDDVVVPNIDRSVFNESAGSRKQTYSRLRLAPSSSSSSATPRRRTPHLRSTASTFANINNSDPENAENAQIVTLLKQLFVKDMDPRELVSVKIDYTHSLPPQQLSSPPPSSPSNVGLTGHKRKRGRPRRNEVLGIEQESAVEVNVAAVNGADGFSSLNEIVVLENVEERDREILNADGVAVDLVALGVLEHPYWEEISRRTQGLGTEEELLVNTGEDKKSYSKEKAQERSQLLVLASHLLNVKASHELNAKEVDSGPTALRKCGLLCWDSSSAGRQFPAIPSGLHLVSCKGVSSYLLSLHDVHDSNLHSSAQYNEIVNDEDKLTSVTISGLAIGDDDIKENLVSHVSSPASGSTSGNHEKQVEINAGILPEGRVGELCHCHKCNITFMEKDELLQHQSSLHRRNRYKIGMRITDGVIIKDGKYECQFCHKTFNERHRYNGHVGAHVRYQAKTTGESPAEPVDPCSFGKFPVGDSMTKTSLKSDNVVEICNAITNNGLNMCSSGNKDNELVGELKEANGNIKAVNEATGVVTEISPCSVAEVLFSGNENKSFHEDAHVNHCAAEIIDDASSMQVRSGNCSLPLDDGTCGIINGNGSMIEKSTSIEKPEQNLAVSVKQQSDFDYLPCNGTSENTSTSGSMASKLTKDPKISTLATAYEKACMEDNVSHLIGKYKVYETHSFGTCERCSSGECTNGVSRHEEMQFGIHSVIPPWNEHENVSKKDDTEALACLLKEPGSHNTSKNRFMALSGHENMYNYEKDDDGVCRRKMDVADFNDFQNIENGESSYPFSTSHAVLNSSSITGTEQGKKLGLCSALTSATDKRFFKEDNMIRVSDDAMDEHKQEPSGGILLSQSGVSEVPDDEFTLNKIYDTPAHPSKLNNIENTGKHELSLSFGKLQTELCTTSNRVEQEIYQADTVNIQSVIHKTYGDQTHLSIRNSSVPGDQTHFSIRNSSVPGDLKQGMPFEIDLPNSSFNNRTHELGSCFDVSNPGGKWNETRGSKIGISGQNIMVGFGSSISQSGGYVTAHGSGRAGHENVFQGCFDAASGPQIPSSSYFHIFSLTSDKDKEGLFGVNKNYDIHTDMLRPGRTDPVEYSFMGEQSSNTSPGESKIFSYSADMEQGLDPSFWLGKDALMPNASHTNQVPLVCVWCRNVFFHDPIQAGIQTGAIGTMCSSCSSRIPGQFNVL